jgi:hypothetical protein
MTTRKGFALSALTAALLAVSWVGAQAESHVRIIRLSYIDGSVQMDRATGQGLEKAILNTPITEGTRIATGNDGLAEVEFENNSSVRLGENSEIHFNKLVVNNEGAKVNDIEVVKGTVYVTTKGNKDDVYRAQIGGFTFQIHKDTELRLSDDTGKVSAAVMKGEAVLQSKGQEVKISKKETLTLDAGNPAGYQIAKGVETDRLDRWNSERSSYQTAYAYNSSSTGPKINGYGYSDLSYYGGWYNIPGVGSAWQPYGVSDWVGWNPYMAGAWAFSPGMGYMWASAYPWGWLPYHYGSWSYIGAGGWFWVPGAANAYNNGAWASSAFQTAPVVHGPVGFTAPMPPPVLAGAAPTTVKVGTVGNQPVYIPGGRTVPNFRSVVPNSMASRPVANSMATVPKSSTPVYAPRTAIANDTARGGPGSGIPRASADHVYAPPPRVSTISPGAGAMEAGSSYGGSRMGGASGASHSMGGSSVGGPSAGSHSMGTPSSGSHATSGSGHGSPK